MKLFLKFDFNTIVKNYLEHLLKESNFRYKCLAFGEIELLDKL